MSYSNYEHYKNSGENNIGLIPLNWKVAKLYMLSKRYAGGTPDKNTPEYWESGTVPWLNSGSVNQFLITTPSNYITSDALEKSSAKWVPKGALLIALAGQGKTKGMVAQTSFDTTCNQSMAAIICRKIDSRYMLWWLVSQYENIRGLSSIDGRDGLNLEMIGGIKCPLPSREEQKAIAAFLDKKTSAIDALIEKKQKLIQLLEEKRSALISQVVTKGLEPNVPMKDSGINWLGKIPENWKVKRLKYVITYNDESLPETTRPDRIINYVDISSVSLVHGIENVDRYEFDQAPSRARRIVRDGDTILSTVRTYLKAIALIKGDIENLIVSTGFMVIRPTPKIDSIFLNYFMQSEAFIGEIVARSVGVSYPAINPSEVAKIESVIPPLNEQRHIAMFLDKKTSEIDKIKVKIETLIALLREYRSALITNVVTGRIGLQNYSEKMVSV
ncbi:Type I restriction enzyme EcoKI specificity protein [Legionella pneumophila]|uniref:restriction endonuclease subunit S n=1 Tax=Legionella pneumophila TaxID=446 RepID=UPI0007707D04|nr:restriction endonuclease subunit S [Legionella pneumophila]MCH9125766.1 restriction endonuclease subunit S [Legionella pneumophila serogroup 1]MCH9161247.1 restriction endonuclease subunit S [Legionella pneumophila serogroup 1]MCH9167571.1 restriction endonuclease subunit S [Legionella pneumophila serogroup 1]MCH9176168.1 restriction endonuclease subunit S [Legionella pneumophila serogroup 1]MCH9179530.1 restriction endonuclease subunit S [Legionella pneumophila serogroup 1]